MKEKRTETATEASIRGRHGPYDNIWMIQQLQGIAGRLTKIEKNTDLILKLMDIRPIATR